MDSPTEWLSGINLKNFDHEDLFTAIDRLEGRSPQELAEIFLKTFLPSFHNLEGTQRWNIYALGGYEHGIENLSPYREVQARILEHLQSSADSQVAIFGTGTGPLEREIFQKNHPYRSITAFDADPGMLQIHERRFADRVDRVCQSLNEQIEGVDHRFDRFTVVNTLELLNIPIFLKNLQSTLASNSRGVIVTPKEGIKTSIPVFRGHVEASQVEMPAGYWHQILSLAADMWDQVQGGRLVLDQLNVEEQKVAKYIQLYSEMLGAITSSLDQHVPAEGLPLASKQMLITGLFNILPPVKIDIRKREELFDQLKSSGLVIKHTEEVNAGLSDLIVVEKT